MEDRIIRDVTTSRTRRTLEYEHSGMLCPTISWCLTDDEQRRNARPKEHRNGSPSLCFARKRSALNWVQSPRFGT